MRARTNRISRYSSSSRRIATRRRRRVVHSRRRRRYVRGGSGRKEVNVNWAKKTPFMMQKAIDDFRTVQELLANKGLISSLKFRHSQGEPPFVFKAKTIIGDEQLAELEKLPLKIVFAIVPCPIRFRVFDPTCRAHNRRRSGCTTTSRRRLPVRSAGPIREWPPSAFAVVSATATSTNVMQLPAMAHATSVWLPLAAFSTEDRRVGAGSTTAMFVVMRRQLHLLLLPLPRRAHPLMQPASCNNNQAAAAAAEDESRRRRRNQQT